MLCLSKSNVILSCTESVVNDFFEEKFKKINAQSTNLNTVAKYYDAQYTMVTTVLIVLLILALLEIVLLNGAAAVRIHPRE